MKHIILDTDLGGDPDDIFTLLLALNSPELNVDLVVTNDEHNGDRVRFTKKIFHLLGKEVPIVAGTDLGNKKCFVVDDLIENKDQPVNNHFLEEIKNIVENNEITHYVCIGPQSNLSKFIKEYPELKDKVKILLMGGAINYRHQDLAEHNVRYDIKSAINVFNSDWDKRYVLSDVTFKEDIKIDENSDFFKELKDLKKPHIDYIIKSMKCFFEKLFPATYMHDPLTLSYLIDKNIIEFDTKKLKINDGGIMMLSEDGKETIMSISAKYDLFWKLFKKRILI